MKQGNKKLFLNKIILTQMLNLRLNGLALSSLAWIYNCDRDSISKQCAKYGIEPDHIYHKFAAPAPHQVFLLERIVSQILPKDGGNYKIVNGERINLGKSYKEYLAESKTQYPPSKLKWNH